MKERQQRKPRGSPGIIVIIDNSNSNGSSNSSNGIHVVNDRDYR